jgi:tripartite-type tricarboxylate transporter receptor subunit TctC
MKNLKRKDIAIIIVIVAAIVGVLAAVFFSTMRRGRGGEGVPSDLHIVVAWNPHSTADDMAHAIANGLDANEELETYVSLDNIPGGAGAAGKNYVFDALEEAERDNVLATSLSAFVTA